MLQHMRDRISGWLTWLIVVVICVMFAMWGVSYYLSDMIGGQQAVAKVNGHTISQAELNQTYQQLKNQQNPQLPVNAPQLRQQALEALVRQHILLQAATAQHLAINPAEIQEMIFSLPELQENGHFSEARYQALLQSMGVNTQGLMVLLQHNALINQYRLGLELSDFALPSETQQLTQLLLEKRSFRYLTIPTAPYRQQVSVSDAQALAYYNDHASDYVTPAQVSLHYLELSVGALAAKVTVSDAQAQAFYNSNRASYVIPEERRLSQITLTVPAQASAAQLQAVQAQAAALEQQLKDGASFASLAKAHSQDPISAAKGGDIGWIKSGQIPGAFQTAAFGLSAVGDVSAPVTTQFGVQILKLTGIKPAIPQSFSAVKAEVISQLQHQQAEQEYAKLGDQLANLTFENPDSLADTATQLGLTVQSTPLFSAQGGSGIAEYPAVIKAAFSNSVLNQGNNSDVINLSNSRAVVIRVAKSEPAQPIPFATAKASIVAFLQQQGAIQLAAATATRIATELRQGHTITALLADNHLSWTTVNQVSRQDEALNLAIVRAAFASPLPTAEAPSVSVVQLARGEQAVVQVTQVTPGSTDAATVASLTPMLQHLYAAESYRAYYQSLRAEAQVTVNRS